MKLFFAMTALLTAGLYSAQANTLTLNADTITHEFQQTTNRPCVIGDSSCQNPTGFDFTLLPAGASSYDSLSPVYTVAQILAQVGPTFFMGFDVNQTDVNQTFSLFTMSINGVVTDTFSASPAQQVPPTAGGGNGNGYADYLIKNFTSLASLPTTDTVQFHAVMPLVNDGREEWFLVKSSDTGDVPEPVTLSLVGGGLLGLGLLKLRKKALQ